MPTDKRLTPSELAQQTLFTTDEVATYLRTTADAIRARVQRGEIPRSAIVQRSKYGRMTFKRAAIDKLYKLTSKAGDK